MAPVVPFLADTSGPFSQLLATEHTAQTVQAWIQERKDVITAIKRQAIDQDTPFDVIYEDIKQLEGDIGRFKRLLQSNEALRADWRQVHMAAWRATVRPLKVVDLPHEILAMVFANFQEDAIGKDKPWNSLLDEPLSRTASGVEVIKKVRLTCRAFCGASSKFLIPTVEVRLTRSSLQRLQEISNHPTISRGVQVIHIDTDAYHPELATDRTRFYQLIQSELVYLSIISDGDMATSRETFAKDCRLIGRSTLPRTRSREYQVLETVLKGLQDLLGAVGTNMHHWQGSVNAPSLRPIDATISSAMKQAHEEYGRGYMEQERYVQDTGTFSKISAAIGLMPSIKKISLGPSCGPRAGLKAICVSQPLRISQPLRVHTQKCEAMLSSQNPFRTLVVCPGTLGATLLEWNVDPPCSLALKLPLLLRVGSGNLTHLEIELPPIEHGRMSIGREALESVGHACEQLTHVNIRATYPRFYTRTSGDMERTIPLLKAILVSTKLEVVKFDLPAHVYCRSYANVGCGQLLANLSCGNLRGLHLSFFSFKLKELRQSLDKVHGRIHLDLFGCKLLDGTWAEALEILRGRADSLSRVVRVKGVEMNQLSLREVQYLRQQFDSEHRDGWYSDQRCPGPASFYIRGGNIPNPLISFDD